MHCDTTYGQHLFIHSDFKIGSGSSSFLYLSSKILFLKWLSDSVTFCRYCISCMNCDDIGKLNCFSFEYLYLVCYSYFGFWHKYEVLFVCRLNIEYPFFWDVMKLLKALLKVQYLSNTEFKFQGCNMRRRTKYLEIKLIVIKRLFSKIDQYTCTLSWKDFLFPELRTLTTMHWMNACSSFVCQSPFIFSHKTKEVWVSRASKCSRMQNKVQF